MFQAIAKSLFGSSNDRYVKSLGKIVDLITAVSPWEAILDVVEAESILSDGPNQEVGPSPANQNVIALIALQSIRTCAAFQDVVGIAAIQSISSCISE